MSAALAPPPRRRACCPPSAWRLLTHARARPPRRTGFAFQLLALLVALAAYYSKHFKQLKAAAWGLLVSACAYNTQTLNLLVGLFNNAPLKAANGPAPAAAAAAYVGMALAILFSFAAIFAGSAADRAAGKAALGGMGVESRRAARVATLARSLSRSASSVTAAFFDSVTLARRAALACFALATAGWAIALGGLAGMQAYCAQNPEDLVAWKLPYLAYPPSGGFDCARMLSGEWWAWVLMGLALAVAAAVARAPALRRFKAAAWALVVAATTVNMTWLNGTLIAWIADSPAGAFRSSVQAAAAGFIIYCIGAIVLLFPTSAYTYAADRAGEESARRAAAPHPRAARAAFVVLQAGAWAAQVVTLVGLALYQNFLSDRGLSHNRYVFSTRFLWYVWALQVVALALVAAAWGAGGRSSRFKAAVWLVLVYAAIENMIASAFNFMAFPALDRGELTYVKVTFAGMVAWDACAFLLMFAGSAVSWEKRHAGDEEGAAAAEGGAKKEDDDDDE